MRNHHRISVIIPAINEAKSIAHVLQDIPDWVDEVIVADNGSTDDTPSIAEAHGARVVHEPHRGYGSACLRGMANMDRPDVVVYLDGDYSDHPQQMDTLVDPIVNDEVDMVIGSRTLGHHERGALTPQARFGNKLACFLMRLFWGVKHTDLGPFRAIRYTSLQQIHMADPDYGWTVEMQIKAALHRLRTTEVPVDYRKRIGQSKVSGTIRGVIGAGYKILSTIFLSAIRYHLYEKKHAHTKRRLIIFTRYPKAGETKTRLIPGLGAEGAANLQRAMTENALRTASALGNVEIEVRYTGADESQMRAWLGDTNLYREQHTGDLGQRMHEAFTTAFEEQMDHVVIMGIDCPGITRNILESAFAALRTHQTTLGPATDGGYYLIGAHRALQSSALSNIFSQMEWGTETVYAETAKRLIDTHTPCSRLAYLNDVDRPEDLAEWTRTQESTPKPALSIIIPTLNEAASIANTLDRPRNEPTVEIIIVDGGSNDDTVSIVQDLGVTVLHAPRGRARQMNIGAASAASDTLLFLHADTLLPENFLAIIQSTLSEPKTSCGAFRFQTDHHTPTLHFMTACTNLRARWLSLPYGDQAYFMTKDSFQAVSGYADVPIMEDYLLIRTLKKKGHIRIASAPLITSARRWKTLGPWRTMLHNQRVILSWFLGTSPEKIAKKYTQHRDPKQ